MTTTTAKRHPGRQGGITPRVVNHQHVLLLDPIHVEPGYILHDGIVLSIEKTYDTDTGAVEVYYFQTPQATVYAGPGDKVNVYGRITEDMLDQLKERFES